MGLLLGRRAGDRPRDRPSRDSLGAAGALGRAAWEGNPGRGDRSLGGEQQRPGDAQR